MLRHLAETGAIYQDATGRWVADDSLEQMALPDSVREVIGARVGRLGPDAERVLSLAAVIGRDFDLDLLARATETSEDDLLDILDAAAAASLVRELADTPGATTSRTPSSNTPCTRTSATTVGRGRTARWPKPSKTSAATGPAPRVGELARHWFSATQPIDLAKAIDYSRQAGDAALAALAPADALRYYAQALDLYAQADDPDPLLGIDLAIGLGTAQRQTGDPAFRETLLDAARRAATSATPTASWPPPWPTTAASSPRSDRSTPTRSRSWRRPRHGFPPTTPTGRSCSPRCVRNSPTAVRSNAARPWPTRPSPSRNVR